MLNFPYPLFEPFYISFLRTMTILRSLGLGKTGEEM